MADFQKTETCNKCKETIKGTGKTQDEADDNFFYEKTEHYKQKHTAAM